MFVLSCTISLFCANLSAWLFFLVKGLSCKSSIDTGIISTSHDPPLDNKPDLKRYVCVFV